VKPSPPGPRTPTLRRGQNTAAFLFAKRRCRGPDGRVVQPRETTRSTWAVEPVNDNRDNELQKLEKGGGDISITCEGEGGLQFPSLLYTS